MSSYDYGESPYGYDQRWADKEGTTTDRLNVARKMCDALREWLDTIFDTSSASTFGSWENPLTLNGLYMWHDDSNGKLRVKTSAPSSIEDGYEVMIGV